MKSKIYKYAAALALILGATACHDDVTGKTGTEESGVGEVNLRSMGIEVSNVEKVIETSAKSKASLDLSDYIVKIYKSNGNVAQEWKYSEMPEVFELPVGDYTAKVFSHQVTKADWDKPYFVGEKDFSIVNDDITNIGKITCVLSNIKVSIRYTDDLRKYMGDDVRVTVVANDNGRLEFTSDETRSGYFEAVEGSSTIIVEFKGTVNGYYETLRHTIADAEAGQHRIITFKTKTPPGPTPGGEDPGYIEPGTGIGIDIDVTDEDLSTNVNNEEELLDPSDRPGGEDPDEPTPPGPEDPDDPKPENTIRIESAAFSFDEPNDPAADNDGIVNIYAPKGVEHFMVKITSTNGNFIASAGELLPLDFDLAYPESEDAATKFSNLGFPVRDGVIGKTELVFNIKNFVPLLAAFPGTHYFQLSVQDSDNMQTVKTLVFVAPED